MIVDSADWFLKAEVAARKWMIMRKKHKAHLFVFDNLRIYLEEHGLGDPPKSKNFGTLMSNLSREGLVCSTGWSSQSTRASRRGGRSLEWRVL